MTDGSTGKTAADTPMLRQYRSVKRRYPEAILFFRLGDFYEMFFADAELAARELDITLTSRPSGQSGRIPMAGVPYHAADQYIARLLDRGHKVAICEQVTDGRTRGLMDRKVVRVLTPGTVSEPAMLDEGSNNYLAALVCIGERWGVAAADLSTGEFVVTECPSPERAIDELLRLQPAELIIPESTDSGLLAATGVLASISRLPDVDFEVGRATEFLLEALGVASLAGFGLDGRPAAAAAAGALAAYAQRMQCRDLAQLSGLRFNSSAGHMPLDSATKRNLELTSRASDGSRQGSLLSVVDRTRTAMGKRMLRRWLDQPLLDLDLISRRHDRVGELADAPPDRAALRVLLGKVRDIERLGARCALSSANARDLVALRGSLRALPELKTLIGRQVSFADLTDSLSEDVADELAALLERAVVDDPPVSVTDGGMVRPGYDEALDRERYISGSGKRWIAELERDERERTGVKSLKVGFNRVFGYYIEVTRANLGAVPDGYIRKQTLANAERFVTPELKEREVEIVGADERANALERDILDRLCAEVRLHLAVLQSAASAVAEIDAAASLAEIAVDLDYVRPEMTDEPVLDIRGGRHAVLEAMMPAGEFVPNDCLLDEQRFAIITGPNMAGKSTYLRQVALICLLAQVGSFVPATSARLGLVDRIFTRVGAGDDLSRGQSTFMIEMIEVAGIINHATEHSLIILDEVGRGTSTFDGLSIAWAVSEYILDEVRPRTLFATHYHELIRLADERPDAVNLSVAVRERGDEVVFLRRVVRGGTDRSYGIEVARLAGLPAHVLARAREILTQLESDAGHDVRTACSGSTVQQLSLFPVDGHPILNEIRDRNLVEITPLEAITMLFQWQRELRGNGG